MHRKTVTWCIHFLGFPYQSGHTLNTWKNRKVFSFNFAGWKPEIKLLAGLVLSGDFDGGTMPAFPPSLLASGGWWIRGIPWHHSSLYFHLHVAFFSGSPCVFSVSHNGTSIGFRTHPSPAGRLMRKGSHHHPYFNHFCKHPISESVTRWGRDTIQPTTRGKRLGDRDHILYLPLWHPTHAEHLWVFWNAFSYSLSLCARAKKSLHVSNFNL